MSVYLFSDHFLCQVCFEKNKCIWRNLKTKNSQSFSINHLFIYLFIVNTHTKRFSQEEVMSDKQVVSINFTFNTVHFTLPHPPLPSRAMAGSQNLQSHWCFLDFINLFLILQIYKCSTQWLQWYGVGSTSSHNNTSPSSQTGTHTHIHPFTRTLNI